LDRFLYSPRYAILQSSLTDKDAFSPAHRLRRQKHIGLHRQSYKIIL